MIREDYCSFELSKLLKEKGFDGPCIFFYNGSFRFPITTADINDTPCPTHALAMKWLREKGVYLNIRIVLSRMEDDVINNIHWVVDILDFNNGDWKDNDIWADTYEEAVEAAIKYSLENLI